MPVEGTTLTVTGTNLQKTETVKIGDTTYSPAANSTEGFTVSDDGTTLTLQLSTTLTKTSGGTISLLTSDGTVTSSASLLDSDLLIADFAGTYGAKSWGGQNIVDNTSAANDNKPASTYFVGVETGAKTKATYTDTNIPWDFGLMMIENNRMVTTDAIPSETKLSDIEIAFEYYMLEDQPDGTNITLKYPNDNSVTVNMPDLTKSAWHTCAISLDKFAKANDIESTKNNYVNFTSTTYGAFYDILKSKYTDNSYQTAVNVVQPDGCEIPLNFYMTNVRLRLKTTEATPTSQEINATINALADADADTNTNTINDFK